MMKHFILMSVHPSSSFTAQSFNEIMIQLIILLTVSVVVASYAYHKKIPYSLPLVIIGLVLGMLNLPIIDESRDFITNSETFQIFVISIFLPALLGEATLKLPFHHLKENKAPILALAIGGTLITYVVIGFASHYLLEVSVIVAFTFAALMSPTDPISVLQIFKPLGVHKRMNAIMEGESLFNDGVGVVLFKISSIYLLVYMEMGVAGFGQGLLLFLKFAVGGLVIGLIIGYIGSISIKKIDNYPLEIAISIIVFFGSFLIGETVHVSGVIAVVVAGLLFGNYGGKIGMSPVTKLNIYNFYDVIAFIANSIIFLMVGLEISRIDVQGKWGMIIISIIIVLIGRSVAVYASLAWLKEIPSSWKHILNYGGLKGSLSIALALSLPRTFEGREEIIVLTFSVVIFSLLFQGLTIKSLINKLGIIEKQNHIWEYEEVIANLNRSKTSISTWSDMKEESLLTEKDYQDLVNLENEKLKKYNQALDQLYSLYPQIKEEQLRDAKRESLYNQYHELGKLVSKEVISQSILERKRKEILEEVENLS
ncbi:cation:proton antiporter [Peribacillus asahii]|uniref:cation:proton antiporter n=1 Tax=Peribacillus asahii TaxID=228899 RepID=UPI002079BAAA|nr:sodium:proton antiporter [Peribacillus asahii]USK84502.1 sodium:proton antiporter [Peribacillus asahii]